MSFTKLFASITASTIWNEPDHTRIVWITMLAMADRDGYVAASIPGLATLARVPLESCIKAVESFTSPDPWSRTKDNDGRRIVEVDGGWQLLNYDKYRATRSPEDQREKTANRVRRYRDRHGLQNGHQKRNVVTLGNDGKRGVTQGNYIAEAEAEADIDSSNEESCTKAAASVPDSGKRKRNPKRKEYSPEFEQFWEASWKRGVKAKAEIAFKRAVSDFGFERLLGATKEFATAYSAKEPQFRPFLETWLNQERYKQPVEDFLPSSNGSVEVGADDYVNWLANLPAN
jgi:hypothetical protein